MPNHNTKDLHEPSWCDVEDLIEDLHVNQLGDESLFHIPLGIDVVVDIGTVVDYGIKRILHTL